MYGKGDIVYYARALPTVSIYEVIELMIRTVGNGWYVGIDTKDKQAYLFYEKDIDVIIFLHRKDALKLVKNTEAKIDKRFAKE